MANVAHASLTGSNLHEPKGAATATAGQVYVADGAGSGDWTLASSLLTEAAWSTGDVKPTFKTTVDNGWVFMNDGSIGSASSAATTRANSDCQDLFTLLWTVCADAQAPVSGGRGASAANDWAANKRITLPAALGRALACYGAGSGLTSRALGLATGAETVTLTASTMPSHAHTLSVSGTTSSESDDHNHAFSGTTASDGSHTHTVGASLANAGQFGASYIPMGNFGTTTTSSDGAHTHTFNGTTAGRSSGHTHTVTSTGTSGGAGSDGAHANMQPTLFLNVMIKL